MKVALWIGIALLVLWTIKVVFEKISKRPIGLGNLANRVAVPAWVKKHWWWVVAAVVLPLPIWLLFIPWVANKWWSGVVYATTEPQPAATYVPLQDKNVGGPLRWSDEATVQLRKRASLEEVRDGVCFVGIIPPSSWLDTTLSCYVPGSGQWEAFLVDRNGVGLLPEQGLGVQAMRQHFTRGTVFPLLGLNSPKKKHATGIKNETSLTSQTGFTVNEMYVQVVGGGPGKLQVDRTEPSGTFQYEVKVGMREVSFTVPDKMKWLWIASVHHPDYEASLEDGSNPKQGIMARVNGELKTLEKPLLYQPGDLASSQIDLMLLLDVSGISPEQIESISPATVIVGIQL